MHQKDIQEKDPFNQNRADEADEADEAGNDEKSFLKALLAERALKNTGNMAYFDVPIEQHEQQRFFMPMRKIECKYAVFQDMYARILFP